MGGQPREPRSCRPLGHLWCHHRFRRQGGLAFPFRPPAFASRLLHGHEVRTPHSDEARCLRQTQADCRPRLPARRSRRCSRVSRIRLAIRQSRPHYLTCFGTHRTLTVLLTVLSQSYKFARIHLESDSSPPCHLSVPSKSSFLKCGPCSLSAGKGFSPCIWLTDWRALYLF